jgi:REP element-mobilizing transposase RayT
VHSRRSIRLPEFDYRSTGAYFVTICSWHRQCIFEDVRIRRILWRSWRSATGRTPMPYDFVVMPNHIHGIAWIAQRGPLSERANAVGAQWTARAAQSGNATITNVSFETRRNSHERASTFSTTLTSGSSTRTTLTGYHRRQVDALQIRALYSPVDSQARSLSTFRGRRDSFGEPGWQAIPVR